MSCFELGANQQTRSAALVTEAHEPLSALFPEGSTIRFLRFNRHKMLMLGMWITGTSEKPPCAPARGSLALR
jgi:hypothetical protein